MMSKIGAANCPNCGKVDIVSIENMTVYMGRGIAAPYAQIKCSRCSEDFAALLSWETAYRFDSLGCEVVGFSKARAELFSDLDIQDFVTQFDEELEVFLSIVDLESS